MDLNVPATLTSPASADFNDGPARAPPARTLHDHPPQAWADALLRKYGPMPVSENARTVLERRYLKKGMKGTRWKPPRRWRAAWRTTSRWRKASTTAPSPRWPPVGGGVLRDDARLDFLPNSPR